MVGVGIQMPDYGWDNDDWNGDDDWDDDAEDEADEEECAPCPECGKEILVDAEMCSACGYCSLRPKDMRCGVVGRDRRNY